MLSHESLAAHTKYLKRYLRLMPHDCQPMDTNRMNLLYFCLSGLGFIEYEFSAEEKQACIEWIYNQQTSILHVIKAV